MQHMVAFLLHCAGIAGMLLRKSWELLANGKQRVLFTFYSEVNLQQRYKSQNKKLAIILIEKYDLLCFTYFILFSCL